METGNQNGVYVSFHISPGSSVAFVHFNINLVTLRCFFDWEPKDIVRKLAPHGVKPHTYANWEKGPMMPSDPRMLHHICSIFSYFDLYSMIFKKLQDEDLHRYYDRNPFGRN